MIFSRTYKYQSTMPIDDIRGRLLGKHVTVHNLDFEVAEKDHMIKIIPHAENDTNIRTLPITHIELKSNGGKTQVVMNSNMRKLDSGGPTLIVVFCTFLLAGALVMYFMNEKYFAYVMAGICVLIFGLFWMRMERGYFDYVRKIRNYVKKSVA
jgi:hypothetical protein